MTNTKNGPKTFFQVQQNVRGHWRWLGPLFNTHYAANRACGGWELRSAKLGLSREYRVASFVAGPSHGRATFGEALLGLCAP